MCVLIKDLRRSVAYVCANKRLTSTSATHFQKTRTPHPTLFLQMYMQIKHLQRSVGDRYANKGLTPLSPSKLKTHRTLRWCMLPPQILSLRPSANSGC